MRLRRLWWQRPALWRGAPPLKGLADNPAFQWWRDAELIQPDSWWGLAADVRALKAQADVMAELGVDIFRFDVPWRELAPNPPGAAARNPEWPGYRWDRLDAILATLQPAGIEPLPVLVFAPYWATAPSAHPAAPPSAPEHFGDLMTAVARRYRGRVRLWELWNEPDHPHSWSGSLGDYVDTVLRPGSSALRAVDPATRVVMAGLADHRNFAAAEGMAAGLYDIANVHVYPSSASPRHVRVAVESVRAVLGRAGRSATPVWVTECGVASAPPTTPSGFGAVVDEVEQARFVRSLFRSVDADALFVYQLRDTAIYASDGATLKRVHWGLTASELTRRKPAFESYRTAVSRAGRDRSR